MFVLGFYHSRSMNECFKTDFTRNAFWCTQVLKRQIVANMALKGFLILKTNYFMNSSSFNLLPRKQEGGGEGRGKGT